jgi:hypothetical protein
MEGTQMEMLNFLWLIWDHYLPLTPTKNEWPPWYPQGGVQIYPKGKFTTQNHEHKSTLAPIAIFISYSPRLKNNILLMRYQSSC